MKGLRVFKTYIIKDVSIFDLGVCCFANPINLSLRIAYCFSVSTYLSTFIKAKNLQHFNSCIYTIINFCVYLFL